MAKSTSPKKKKSSLDAMAGTDDPRAALDSAALLDASRKVLARLEDDLRQRAEASPAVTRALRDQYEREKAAERTAETFAGWSAALATQVAAAWLLSCVFVRTLEDRGLLRQARIAGPGAMDSQRLFFQLAPSLTERDYLLMVWKELAQYPAARGLFDAEHSLVWKLSPSADMAKALLALFRTPTAEAPAFRFGQASTRFLGDLYQDLSEDVRKRYALLQTPDFVESFILDRTLEPAVVRFGLDDTTVIDPTCGSGHFLLGAFGRLFEHRRRLEPGVDARVAAVKAVDAVYGADINPYAVAIARFRLTLEVLEKAGYGKLADAPALPLHVVVADSLRVNPQHAQPELWQQDAAAGAGKAWVGEAFALEDEQEARAVLFRRYAAVVGNPPYITEKDPAKREVYRKMYVSAAGKYALSAPFCERFFQLARDRGYCGQITANSFMKREFGKKLIEEYLPTVNVELIVNTSGAYIPGHGTPTVLLFGTQEKAVGRDVLAVLAKRGEPSTPENPAEGKVWRSVVDHWEEVGYEDEYLSVARVDRGERGDGKGKEATGLAKHPWSLGGGGASELKELLEERAERRLGDVVAAIGPACFTGLDDVFVLPLQAIRPLRLEASVTRPMILGEVVRDWELSPGDVAITPYARDVNAPLPFLPESHWGKHLWCFRTAAKNVMSFGGQTREQQGSNWWEWYRWIPDRLNAPLRIVFAFVATHNQFCLDRGGCAFSRTAPTITLPSSADDGTHLALVAYLNSSLACFWMKQVFFEKSSQNYVGDVRDKPERIHYEFAGTGLEALPLPALDSHLASLGEALARAATQRSAFAPAAVLSRLSRSGEFSDVASRLRDAQQKHEILLGRMIVLQEEVDWVVYVAAGLCDASLLARTRGIDLDARSARAEERPFKLGGAPADCALADLWSDRLDAIRRSPYLQAVERPLFKRPWLGPQGVFHRDGWSYTALAAEALVTWLEGVLQDVFDGSMPVVRSARTLVQSVQHGDLDSLFAFAEIGAGLDSTCRIRLTAASMPYLAAHRYTESGIARYELWCELWSAQRSEDAGGPSPRAMPSKYSNKDFREGTYYSLRGPLDVPKERFISYPGCESDDDGEPVYGWAGWDHLQRAQALAALYMDRKTREGWPRERLVPMLAGLLELIPWVKQWHNEPNAEYDGLRMGDYFAQFLDGELRLHSLTPADLRAWRPAKKSRGKPKPAPAAAAAADAADAPPPKPKRPRKPKAPTGQEGEA